jgi:perosamine synthetase
MSKRWRIPNSKPWITEGDKAAVSNVVEWASAESPGFEVAAFEQELAAYLGRKYVVCVSSGTMALELAFMASGANRAGINPFGFIATANAVERRCDLGIAWEPDGMGYTLGKVRETKCAIADACQAFGAKLPPSLADCYSFNANKPVTCLGGGCVATDDEYLAMAVRKVANQGRVGPWCDHLGTNARMSDMQAALGRSQLRRVGNIMAMRRWAAMQYENWLPCKPMIKRAAGRESWFLYPIELSNRDEVHAQMLERGIQTRSCADWLLPAHPYYAEKYGYKRGDFPEAERRADRTLLLPLYPEMTLEQVQEVCSALEECDARA